MVLKHNFSRLKKEIERAAGIRLEDVRLQTPHTDDEHIVYDKDDHTYFHLYRENEIAYGWKAAQDLSSALKNMIALAIQQALAKESTDSDLHAWQIKQNWTAPRVPFLIIRRHDDKPFHFQEWNRVLNAYFENQAALFQLADEEVLLIIPYSFIREEENGTDEQMIEMWAESIIELMHNEGLDHDYICAHSPIRHPEEMAAAISVLREMSRIGHAFHPTKRVHAPWKLRLEHIIAHMDGDVQSRMTQELDTRFQLSAFLQDEHKEMLYAFFENNLNISETARTLHMHRNTLIYRLDRLKEETGIDVRRFDDAVLLYFYLLLQRKPRS